MKGLYEFKLDDLRNIIIDSPDLYKTENPIFGDMRTQQVQRGNYYKTYYGKKYLMDAFVGLVKEVRFYSTDRERARVLIELQKGKHLAFFARVDNNIKEGTIIEAVGICLKKPTGFFNFRCLGGCRRLLTQNEINQLINGRQYEELELEPIPWEIISFVKATEPISA